MLTDAGALLPYTPDTVTNVPVPIGGSATLYFKGSACEASTGPAGNRTPYLVMTGTPAQLAAIQDSPPVVGSAIYVQQQVAPETISVGSAKTSGTCSASAGSITAVAARAAGTVPTVQKPLVLKAVG